MINMTSDLLVVRDAGVLETVTPQDLIWKVGRPHLFFASNRKITSHDGDSLFTEEHYDHLEHVYHDPDHHDHGHDHHEEDLDGIASLRGDALHGEDDLELHFRRDVPCRELVQWRLLI